MAIDCSASDPPKSPQPNPPGSPRAPAKTVTLVSSELDDMGDT